MMRFAPMRKDDWFEDVFPDFGFAGNAMMKTDIREKDGKYVLDIDLPGYKKEDIKISLYNGNLTVKAEHSTTNEEKDAEGRILRQERYSGTCSRSWYVGDAVKDSDINASYHDGILTLSVPSEKATEESETKYIDIL